MTLSIDQSSCIKCGKCVKVCPAAIFTQVKVGEVVGIEHEEMCIGCGHCAAACPTGAVKHSDFPAEKVHPIDYTLLPTPEQMMLLCKARRSNRTMTKQPVPAEMLDMIVEAAHRAPTATNAQSVSFTLVTDPKRVREVSEYTLGIFGGVLKKLKNPVLKPLLKPLLKGVYRYVPVFERLLREDRAGNDPILRHATALLFIHTPESNRFGCEDCNLAYQNASLMAESLGVSQVYMGFVMSAVKQDNKRGLAKSLGIDGHIHAIMALGMPAFRYPNYIDRKDIKVTKLE